MTPIFCEQCKFSKDSKPGVKGIPTPMPTHCLTEHVSGTSCLGKEGTAPWQTHITGQSALKQSTLV